MKKTIILICLILFSVSCFAQVPPVSRPVCAFCEAEITLGEPHKPGCPNYVAPPKPESTSSSSSAASALSISSQKQLTAEMATLAVGAYIGMLSDMISAKQRFNASADKLYGVPGCEDDGYVVARGKDGYYSIWNSNGNFWAILDPDTSTLTDIILYNARATCIQRWLGHKWCVTDLSPNGKYKKGAKDIVGHKYDAVKCVAKDAPIAVGKNKKNEWKWGLVTRDPATEKWEHTVEDKWDDIDILPVGNKSFALAKSNGQTTLFSSEGKQLTRDSYSQIVPFAEIDSILYFLTENDKKWGIMTETGDVAVDCIYDEIKIDSAGIIGSKGNESVVISKIQ